MRQYLVLRSDLINAITGHVELPQGLKPAILLGICGTAEAVPLQSYL
jgi:hypothetical protein